MAPPGVDYAFRLRACEHLTEQFKRSGRSADKAKEMAGNLEAEVHQQATTAEHYCAMLDRRLHEFKSSVEQHVSREEHTTATSQQAPLALEAGPLMQQPALPQAPPPWLAPTGNDQSAMWHAPSAFDDVYPLPLPGTDEGVLLNPTMSRMQS